MTKQQTAVKYRSSPRQIYIPRYTIPMNSGDDYTRAKTAFLHPSKQQFIKKIISAISQAFVFRVYKVFPPLFQVCFIKQGEIYLCKSNSDGKIITCKLNILPYLNAKKAVSSGFILFPITQVFNKKQISHFNNHYCTKIQRKSFSFWELLFLLETKQFVTVLMSKRFHAIKIVERES